MYVMRWFMTDWAEGRYERCCSFTEYRYLKASIRIRDAQERKDRIGLMKGLSESHEKSNQLSVRGMKYP